MQAALVKRANIRTCVLKQSALTKQHIEQEYADVFKVVGQYEKEYHMQLNDKVEGVIQQPRIILYATQPKLKEILDMFKEQNFIADVDKPTELVSNIVIVKKKNGSLRLCLDPKPLNEAIRRERHNIPTSADVQSQQLPNRNMTSFYVKSLMEQETKAIVSTTTKFNSS